jgi:hypothetical protein
MARRSSARNYAAHYFGGRKVIRTAGSTTGGGDSILNTEKHALDGDEHTEATEVDKLLATYDHAGLAPPLSKQIVQGYPPDLFADMFAGGGGDGGEGTPGPQGATGPPGTGGGGGGGVGDSVILQLDYQYAGSDISGASISATTWTDLTPDENFNVDSADSIVQIDVRAMIQALDTSSGEDLMGLRVIIDAAGTPITKQLAGNLSQTSAFYENPFIGTGTISIEGLSPGTHTVAVQIWMAGGGNYYLRPSSVVEFLAIQVLEFLPVGNSIVSVGARGVWATNQSVNDSTYAAVNFTGTDEWDTDGFHNPASNSNRFTCPAGKGGKYRVTVNIGWESNATGYRGLVINKNLEASGSGDQIWQNAPNGIQHWMQLSRDIDLAPDDFVSASAYQTSGSPKNIVGGSMSIVRLAAADDAPWQSYTPALTASTTNPTLGSGSSATAKFKQIGKTVHVRGQISFGTSGTNAGSGEYRVSLPTGLPQLSDTNGALGSSVLFDSSASSFALAVVYGGAGTTVVRLAISGASLVVSHGAPWAWDASDILTFEFTYETA